MMCVFLATAASCTSKEGALKEKSLEMAQKKFYEAMTFEAGETLKNSDWIRDGYRDFIVKRSKVKVHEINYQGETHANVIIVVETYSPNIRRGLVGVAQRADVKKERMFNFGEALPMVAKQVGESSKLGTYPLTIYKFTKNPAGDWVLTP